MIYNDMTPEEPNEYEIEILITKLAGKDKP
jgi:hypothetical protein